MAHSLSELNAHFVILLRGIDTGRDT